MVNMMTYDNYGDSNPNMPGSNNNNKSFQSANTNGVQQNSNPILTPTNTGAVPNYNYGSMNLTPIGNGPVQSSVNMNNPYGISPVGNGPVQSSINGNYYGPGAVQNSANPGQGKADGINKDQVSLLQQLFGSMMGQIGNPYQFNGNAQAASSNFDGSGFFNNMNPFNAASNGFNAANYLGNTPMSQAAQVNYDPSQYLGNILKMQAANNGFNANQFGMPDSMFQDALNKFNQPLTGLANRMQGWENSGLPQLAQSDMQNLDALRNAAASNYSLDFNNQKDQMLQDLFGRGLNTSTVALDQAGKLEYGRAQMMNQIQSDAAQRQLALQQQMKQNQFQGMNSEAGFLNQGMQNNLSTLGLQQQGRIAAMQSQLQAALQNASLQQGANQANLDVHNQRDLAMNQGYLQSALQNASMQQQTNMGNADRQQQSNMLAAQLMQSTMGQNAGFQQQAMLAGNQQQFDIAQLLMNSGLQQSLANAGFQQTANNNNFQGSLANYQGLIQQMGMNQGFLNNMLGSYNQRKQFGQQMDFNYAQLQQQMEIEKMREQNALQQIQAQKPGFLQSLFGGLGGILGGIGGLI